MRQFVSETELDSQGTLTVSGKKYHYLTAVLRARPGDMMYVRLPGGELQGMTLASVDAAKKTLVLQVAGPLAQDLHANPLSEKPSVEIWLFQFVAKPAKMELILRQATECGVSHFIPVAGQFSQKGNNDSAKKQSAPDGERWKRIITEAREQSGSPVETCVHPLSSLDEAVSLWKENEESSEGQLAVTLYEMTKETVSMHQAVKEAEKKCDGKIKRAALVVGAEGGISPEEISLLQKAGFVSVHFLTNILRCETAALYGLSALQTAVFEREDWLCRE